MGFIYEYVYLAVHMYIILLLIKLSPFNYGLAHLCEVPPLPAYTEKEA